MPTESYRFPVDGPTHLRVRNSRGTVQITADDIPETLVDVSGRDDVGTVRVSASDDGREVTVEVPRSWRPGGPPRYDITVRVPVRSTVDVVTASATIDTRGALAAAEAKSASGAITIEQVEGDCRAQSASGHVALGTIGGTVTLKSASGDLHVARAGGRCTARTASGAVDVGWAGDLVSAVSASGGVTVRDAARGEVSCKSTSGNVAVGVRKGTLVWLDLSTVSGRTISSLRGEAGPAGDGSEDVLTIKASTVSGNITIAPSGATTAAA
ncbi:MAG: DUF4097 family beta strand repeat-containing protein [Acidimicrobiales bacterium]